MSEMPSTFARRSAAGGLILWLFTLLLATSDSAPTELIHKVVFFAVLVVVPLGLSVVAPDGETGASLYKLIVFAQPVAALFTMAAFFLEKGVLAATLASEERRVGKECRSGWSPYE